MQCARTAAAFGNFRFKRRDDKGSLYECTREYNHDEVDAEDNFDDLEWPSDDADVGEFEIVVEQEQVPVNLRQSIIVSQPPLGKGSFGMVYKCRVRIGPVFHQDYVIKLPRPLVSQGALQFSRGNGYVSAPNQSDKDVQEAMSEYRTTFRDEFVWFETIYEPTTYFKRFQGGQRAEGIVYTDFKRMKDELAVLKAHPGRRYIHEYKHIDYSIPAIFSVRCDGTIEDLRRGHPEWFLASGPDHMSQAWKRVAEQVGEGIMYMKTRAVVHTDIKPSNILYRNDAGDPRRFICQISDFGICYDDDITDGAIYGTMYYFPQTLPLNDFLQPINLSVHNYACTVAQMMSVGRKEWCTEYVSNIKGKYFMKDVDQLRKSRDHGLREIAIKFFPLKVSTSDLVENPIWASVVWLLRQNYRKLTDDNTTCYDMLVKIVEAVKQEALPSADIGQDDSMDET